jgi:hypothetical protein
LVWSPISMENFFLFLTYHLMVWVSVSVCE